MRGENDLVEMLISHGADIRTPDNEKMTVLHESALKNSASGAELLLSKGAEGGRT